MKDEIPPWERAGGYPKEDWVRGWLRIHNRMWEATDRYKDFVLSAREIDGAWIEQKGALELEMKKARDLDEAYRAGDSGEVADHIYEDEVAAERQKAEGEK